MEPARPRRRARARPLAAPATVRCASPTRAAGREQSHDLLSDRSVGSRVPVRGGDPKGLSQGPNRHVPVTTGQGGLGRGESLWCLPLLNGGTHLPDHVQTYRRSDDDSEDPTALGPSYPNRIRGSNLPSGDALDGRHVLGQQLDLSRRRNQPGGAPPRTIPVSGNIPTLSAKAKTTCSGPRPVRARISRGARSQPPRGWRSGARSLDR